VTSFSDVATCGMGFIGNTSNGSVSITNNTMGDPDAIEIGLNSINGSLDYSGNALAFPAAGDVPTNSFDGSPPNPNTVTGQETGQWASRQPRYSRGIKPDAQSRGLPKDQAPDIGWEGVVEP